MHNTSPTAICNLALDAVPSARITSLAEDSLQAQKCALQYPQVFAETLETWPWNFARRTDTLAARQNYRAAEWAYAYQVPNHLALPIKVLAWEAGADRPTPCTPSGREWDFDIIGDVLFTDAVNATLEHLDYHQAPAVATAMFVRTVALKLASRICLPLTKSERRERALLEQAEVFEQRARAGEANRRPQTYGIFIPEAVRYRMDLGDDVQGQAASDNPLSPSGGSTTPLPPNSNPPTIYTFPDWSSEFEAALDFTP